MSGAVDMEKTLKERFRMEAFRPGQREVIQALFKDRAALAVFPTGGGKSLCYQLPALLLPGLTLVVSPLIALMKDQIDALAARGIEGARMDSSLTREEHNDVVKRARSGTLKILYVAPERFANERFLDLLASLKVGLFAVDEAHSISEWGHNFRPDYLKLAAIARDIRAERILALTATATPSVVDSICERFQIPRSGVVVTGFYRPNLEIRTIAVRARDKDNVLVEHLRAARPGPGIVYVTLQKTAERVAQHLLGDGFEAAAYHAGLEAEERARVQDSFMRSQSGIVVATIAFGMGIDKASVRTVTHYDLPKSLESYSQEIGRAGRDGQPSTVALLACADDVGVLEGFACGDTPTREALTALVADLLRRGESFALDLHELGDTHDLRPLVLRTALTHLELLGALKQGTPVYATHQVRPLVPVDEIVGRFQGERAEFIRGIFERSKKGRVWTVVAVDEVAALLKSDRGRVVRALDWLAEQDLVELTPKDVRHRYTRTSTARTEGELVDELHARFTRHEAREIERVRQVLGLVTASECQTNVLVRHFGEVRAAPCGHCTFCLTKQATVLPPPSPVPAFGTLVDNGAFRTLVSAHPRALGHPRQQARFLCGLGSPAVTRAKLSRHALYGALAAHRFHDVLAWRVSGSVPA